MQQRLLGDGLTVSALGFGAMGLSEFYGATDDQASLQVLQTVVERGVTMIDSADYYGRGHNERLIGHFLSKLDTSSRAKVKIATKCGIERHDDDTSARRINNQPSYIRRCCHQSFIRRIFRINQLITIEKNDVFLEKRVESVL
ncbi:MAG: aldo/keto reductase [Enterobacteriaceae bacterium]